MPTNTAGPGRTEFEVLYSSQENKAVTKILDVPILKEEEDLIQDFHIDDVIAALKQIELEIQESISKKTTDHHTNTNPPNGSSYLTPGAMTVSELSRQTINKYASHFGTDIQVTGWQGQTQTFQRWLEEFFARIHTYQTQIGSVTITPALVQLSRGQYLQLNATVRKLTGEVISKPKVNWTSANLSIVNAQSDQVESATATISGQAIGGPVSVTAQSGAQTASCIVTVIEGSGTGPGTGPDIVITPPEPPTLNVDLYHDFDVISHQYLNRSGKIYYGFGEGEHIESTPFLIDLKEEQMLLESWAQNVYAPMVAMLLLVFEILFVAIAAISFGLFQVALEYWKSLYAIIIASRSLM